MNWFSENNFTKYDADTNVCFKIYAVAQYFIMLGGAILYMSHFKDMSVFYRVVFFLHVQDLAATTH